MNLFPASLRTSLGARIAIAARRDQIGLVSLSLMFAYGLGLTPLGRTPWDIQAWAGMLPTVVWMLAFRRRAELAEPTYLAGLALIVFSTLSILWGDNTGGHDIRWLGDAVCTAALLTAGYCTLRVRPLDATRLARLLGLLGGANALLTMAWLAWFGLPPAPERASGFLATNHPILGSAVITACMLCALWCLMEKRTGWWMALTLPPMLGFMLVAGSRGPLLALAVSLIVLVAASLRHWKIAAAMFGGALLVLGILVLAWPDLLTPISYAFWRPAARMEVWTMSLERIAERPFFGHGLAAQLAPPPLSFPHDLYLSVIFYTGIAGFLLFLLLLACFGRALLGIRHRAEFPLILALIAAALVNGLTDLGQVTKGPSEMWYIFWLPILLAAGLSAHQRIRNTRAPA